ncbi:KCNJ8 [Symbiodinium pilosum]|uniref:KCNJ8 protein n=1 Tax=Symbiodinium pilosum TaxID=2952 RepID=A0A812XD92_SYMPI|nr:KCNJ8 [Symbiodinium pilosum]
MPRYFACFAFFALFWIWFTDVCDIGLDSYRDAFYLSVETQMTIGYGHFTATSATSQIKRGKHVMKQMEAHILHIETFSLGCPRSELWRMLGSSALDMSQLVAVLIVVQTVVGLMLDATVIGVVFQKLANANARANTVIFSDTALLEVEEGCAYLRFRVADMSWRPLSQATMQVYCVQHHRDESQPRGIRVELAAVHLEEPDTDIHNGIIFLGLPAMVSHKINYESPLSPDVPAGTTGSPSPNDVRKYLIESPYLEVLVLLSGTEESTGAIVEARHSYTLDDMFWNRAYGTCVSINSEGYHCVDFHAIHHTYPLSALTEQRHLSMPNGAIAHGISHTFPATLDANMDSDNE